MINQQRLVDTFLELVAIDSPSGQEAEIGRHLAGRLQALGLETEIDAAGNLIGRLNGTAGDPLLLSAHMDTVGKDTDITPVIRDGIITSDGTTILGADDKSGVAAILETLTALKDNNLPHPPLEVVISVSEEMGLAGARQVDTGKLQSRHGIVLDSGGPENHVVVEAPGQDSLVITVRGVASHAGSEPEKGINAIRVASEAIAAMPMGRIDGETTCNVGIIEGGTARNIVPDRVTVIGEARSRDMDKLAHLTARIVRAFEEAAARHNTTAEVEVRRAYSPYVVAEDAPILQAVGAALAGRGLALMRRSSGGGTDGNIYNAAGITCVVISTGMEDVHTVNEHIAIADMVAGTELLLATVQRLAA